MNTKQAKDFLVQQAAEQAALENVPFSDLEKRMMYFTESDPPSCNNPIDLNAEFESQYDAKKYEHKISQLLHHARKRLKHQNPEQLRNWNEAVRTLRKGDHYILVLLDAGPESDQQGPRMWMVIGLGIGLGIGMALLAMLGIILDRHGLFPRRLFAWIGAAFGVAFGWVSDNPATRRLQLDLIVIALIGAWVLFQLAKVGALRQFFRVIWNGATSSVSPKRRRRNRF